MRNVFISFENGENVLIHTQNLSVEECEKFARKACRSEVIDAYEIADNELQYYCIDEQIVLTVGQEEKVRRIIS